MTTCLVRMSPAGPRFSCASRSVLSGALALIAVVAFALPTSAQTTNLLDDVEPGTRAGDASSSPPFQSAARNRQAGDRDTGARTRPANSPIEPLLRQHGSVQAPEKLTK